jgi:WD40 repeat protein
MSRSGLALSILCISMFGSAQAADLTPLAPVSTEYTRVQVADWIDGSSFAMGRWDGSLSIFQVGAKPTFAVKLVQSFVTSGGDGVEMVGTLDQRTVIFSDNASQLGILTRMANELFGAPRMAPYDSAYGVADSVTSLHEGGVDLVVTGHANGFALVWERSGDKLSLLRTIDLKSANPIPGPYPLKNIRGLAVWRDGVVISGSEDGDLVAFDAAAGKVLFRQRYSPMAERGINGISLVGDRLLVVNCAVGPKDRNLWLYKVGEDGFSLLDSVNLVRDVTRKQVFDFDVDAFDASGKTRFVSSTEEGLIWSGSVASDKIQVEGAGEVSNNGAASLDVNPADGSILAGSQDLLIFPPLQ